MPRRLRSLCLIVGVLLMSSVVTQAAPPADSIAAVVKDFDAFARAQDPVRAADRGDAEAARRWPDDSPEAVAARKLALLDFQRRLQAVPAQGLADEDALNRALLITR